MKPTIKQQCKTLVGTPSLTAGTTFTRTNFIKLAKTVNPNLHTARKTDAQKIRSNLALVNIQRQLNEELAKSGLYIKSRNYYSEFSVVDKQAANKEVARYDNQAVNSIRRASVLRKGILRTR